MRIKTSEANVLKAVNDYLTAKRIVHWRQNSGAFIGEYEKKGGEKSKRRFVQFLRWLWPKSTDQEEFAFLDIAGILPNGRFFTVEVKQPGKKPSKEQRNTIRMINERTKAVALWTDNIDDFIEQFEKILRKGD